MNEVRSKMDEALESAISDYIALSARGNVTEDDVIAWLRKWYRQAGYKRLCRYLLSK